MGLDIEYAAQVRAALEPITHKMVGSKETAGSALAIIHSTSVAVSMRRIADALEKQNKLIDTLINVHKGKR